MSPNAEGPIPPSETEANASLTPRQRAIVAGVAILGLLLVAGVIAAVVYMVGHPAETETIRDVFIVFMALESLVIGLALIILIVQLARLSNLLQNEIRPILESTRETVGTLRGTTRFLSSNLVEPVVKVNSSVAALRRLMEILGLGRPR